jgi:hypothetical protein
MAALTLLLIFTILNFTLWFYHSRSIQESLNFAKKVFAVKNLNFTYKDIYFDTFKSWKLETNVVGLRISDDSGRNYVEFDNLKIISMPFDLKIEMYPSAAVKFSFDSIINKNNKQLVFDHLFPPRVDLYLDNALEILRFGLLNSQAANPFKNISKATYADHGFKVIDTYYNQEFMSFKPNAISFITSSEPMNSTYNLKINLSGYGYNQDFTTKNPLNDKALNELKRLGSGQVNIDTDLINSFSDSTLKYIDEMEKSNKEINRLTFDMYTLRFNTFEVINDKFTASINGNFSRSNKVGMPYFDLNLAITNYKDLLTIYKNLYNDLLVLNHGSLDPNLLLLTNNQEHSLLAVLKRYSTNNKDLEMHFIRSDEHPAISVSGTPIFRLISDIYEIFPNFVPIPINELK